MRAVVTLEGAERGPGSVTIRCHSCGWRERIWGLTAKRWDRARAARERHAWCGRPNPNVYTNG